MENSFTSHLRHAKSLDARDRSGRVLVDGKPEIELEDIVLRDRIQLSEEGILVPIIVLHSDIPTSTNVDDNAEKLPTNGDADDTKTALNAGTDRNYLAWVCL